MPSSYKPGGPPAPWASPSAFRTSIQCPVSSLPLQSPMSSVPIQFPVSSVQREPPTQARPGSTVTPHAIDCNSKKDMARRPSRDTGVNMAWRKHEERHATPSPRALAPLQASPGGFGRVPRICAIMYKQHAACKLSLDVFVVLRRRATEPTGPRVKLSPHPSLRNSTGARCAWL